VHIPTGNMFEPWSRGRGGIRGKLPKRRPGSIAVLAEARMVRIPALKNQQLLRQLFECWLYKFII
jgi:hypothetical protein